MRRTWRIRLIQRIRRIWGKWYFNPHLDRLVYRLVCGLLLLLLLVAFSRLTERW